MNWHEFLIPLLSAVFAFAGSIAGTRVDIAWIKKVLDRHEAELTILRLHTIKTQVREKPNEHI